MTPGGRWNLPYKRRKMCKDCIGNYSQCICQSHALLKETRDSTPANSQGPKTLALYHETIPVEPPPCSIYLSKGRQIGDVGRYQKMKEKSAFQFPYKSSMNALTELQTPNLGKNLLSPGQEQTYSLAVKQSGIKVLARQSTDFSF